LEKKQYFLFFCSLQIIFLIELSIGSEPEHHRHVVQYHRFVFFFGFDGLPLRFGPSYESILGRRAAKTKTAAGSS
jgi:hypothetical protein